MKKYEYKKDIWEVCADVEENPLGGYVMHLNEMGKDGWELVSYTKNYTFYDHTYTYLSIFKRAYYDE